MGLNRGFVENIARMEQADDGQKGPKDRTSWSARTGVDTSPSFPSKYQQRAETLVTKIGIRFLTMSSLTVETPTMTILLIISSSHHVAIRPTLIFHTKALLAHARGYVSKWALIWSVSRQQVNSHEANKLHFGTAKRENI